MAFPLSVLSLKKNNNIRILEDDDKKIYGKKPKTIFDTNIENIRKSGIIIDIKYVQFLNDNILHFYRNSIPILILVFKIEEYGQEYKQYDEYKNLINYIAREKLSEVELARFEIKLNIQLKSYYNKIKRIRNLY